MAGLAGDFPFIPMIQREVVGHQLGRCPGSGAVTSFTFQAKLPGVNGGFFVAVSTGARRLFKLLFGMATLAGSFFVRSIQNKDEVVVEVGRFATPLVTLQAGGAKQVNMFGHKRSISLGVTGLAIYSFDGVNCLFVAIVAGHFCLIEIGLVGHQTEIGEAIMVEETEGHAGNFGLASGVISVAGLASLGVYELAMQTISGLSLFGDGGVALFAEFGGDALPGGVAKGALLLKLSVRSEIGEGGLSRPRIGQFSRIKRSTPP